MSGDVAAAAVLGHGLVGALRLFGKVSPLPAGASQRSDEEGGQQGGVHVVSHGVGDRQEVPTDRPDLVLREIEDMFAAQH